jgi:uncharacterized protein
MRIGGFIEDRRTADPPAMPESAATRILVRFDRPPQTMDFDTAFFTAMAAAVAAGLVRGFTGFGAALIFMPVASAAFGPVNATAAFLVMDELLTLPMLVSAVRHCRWPIVLPTAMAAVVAAPFGAYVLATGDPVVLRWGLSAVVVLLLLLVASGWRYHREPSVPVSAGVGIVSGLLGGFGQVSGPPVIALWVSGPHPAMIIRANMFVFFGLISVSSFAAYLWNGFFTTRVFWLIAALTPAYALALFVGARLFGHSGGTGYRQLAYGVIAIAAITSVPAFDGLLR